ncbi:Myb-like DNA-binding domain containing protein [Tritrichomonas foetus]|uniref:Myb-like DNA-binding domain containing protein n=1 Tax=Tritrichomonas foetus TaxID=1144522 RepID=A0A1J4KT84_9EUKA|nr:Myb-like DNA-binding domain containing protein [Tritrichomonas foetus]|eukprot:OHT14338.1 Myb-like DNA-binding domain containing protein [Tritrichomonas foetus]
MLINYSKHISKNEWITKILKKNKIQSNHFSCTKMGSISPLVEIAINFANDAAGHLPEESISSLKNIFHDFLQGQITDSELIDQTHKICHSKSPAERIIAVIATEKDEVPEAPKGNDNLNNARKKTRSWSNGEDNRLMMGVHKYGLDNWNLVAQFVGNGRSRSQCSQRWIRVLDPKICKNHWTAEEEAQLMELVTQYGEKSWMRVANCLGNRSDVQCRYRYQMLKKGTPNSSPSQITGTSTNASSSISNANSNVAANPIISTHNLATPTSSPALAANAIPQNSKKNSGPSIIQNSSPIIREIPLPNIEKISSDKKDDSIFNVNLTFLVDEIVPPQFEMEEVSFFFGQPLNYELSNSLEYGNNDSFFDSSYSMF